MWMIESCFTHLIEPAGWCIAGGRNPSKQAQNIVDRVRLLNYAIASTLTSPVCLAHRHWKASKLLATSTCDEAVLKLKAITYGFLSLFTTLPAIGLRRFANVVPTPFICLKGNAAFKQLDKDTFQVSVLNWNVCGIKSGHGITDGGVAPMSERIAKIIKQIRELNPDILFLYELFEEEDARTIAWELRDLYPLFYLDIGKIALGAPSAIFGATKYRTQNFTFTPFDKEGMSDGRSKWANKGAVSFDILSDSQPFCFVLGTHPPHSEEPAKPTLGEKKARAKCFSLIRQLVQKRALEAHIAAMIGGDLNADKEEILELFGKDFILGKITNTKSISTWGGDEGCCKLLGKGFFSPPMDLDYAAVLNDGSATLCTEILSSGFIEGVLNVNTGALSDHVKLLSTVTLHPKIQLSGSSSSCSSSIFSKTEEEAVKFSMSSTSSSSTSYVPSKSVSLISSVCLSSISEVSKVAVILPSVQASCSFPLSSSMGSSSSLNAFSDSLSISIADP